MKSNNIHIIGIPEEEKEQGIKNLFEKNNDRKVPNLVTEKATQVQEAQRVPINMNKEAGSKTHHNKNGRI